jgi:type VI secretion system secreted protein Hcp
MAVDAYLQIEGIKGESMDDKHKDWIECLDRGWPTKARPMCAATAGARKAVARRERRRTACKPPCAPSNPAPN